MRMHSERVPANSKGKAIGIIPAVVHATPEFTWYRSRLNAEYEIAQSIVPYPRWEIVVEDAGTVLAAMVLQHEYDPHVGECCTVQWAFILPEHRGLLGARMQRAAVRVARANGYNVLSYAKRVQEGVYEIRYRKLNSKGATDGQEAR